jgi:hypothetical protein
MSMRLRPTCFGFSAARQLELLVFVLIVALRLPTIHWGLDVTDTGYHLTNQDLARRLGWSFVRIAPVWWLSDVVGGWWLALGDSVWHARLGGVLVNGLVGWVVAKTLFLLYPPRLETALAVAAAGWFGQSICLVHYESVPLFLYALFAFYVVRIHLQPSRRLYPLLGGILLTLLMCARLPLALAAAVPLLALHRERALARAYVGLYSTALLGVFLVVLSLQASGLLQDCLSYPVPSDEHGWGHLCGKWREQLARVLALEGIPRFSWDAPLEYVYITVFLALLVLHVCVGRAIASAERALCIMGAAFPILFTLGSASGLAKVHMGLWWIGGSTMALCIRAEKKTVYFLALFLISFMGYEGAKYVSATIYRDAPHRSQLDTALDAPRLEGIYTTRKRAASLQSLIQQIQLRTHAGERILAYPYISMVYYASGTLPWGDHAWLTLLSVQELHKKVQKWAADAPPLLIVRAKTDAVHPRWGDVRTPCPADALREKVALLDDAIARTWRLTLVWSNLDFDLYTVHLKS